MERIVTSQPELENTTTIPAGTIIQTPALFFINRGPLRVVTPFLASTNLEGRHTSQESFEAETVRNCARVPKPKGTVFTIVSSPNE